jgi:hypothetical protein
MNNSVGLGYTEIIALFGLEWKVKGKKMRGMKVEEMKVSRKYDDILVVWYK